MSEGTGAGHDARPLCACHGEPCNKAGRERNGKQRWLCRHKAKEINARPYSVASRAKYEASDRGRAVRSEVNARYAVTPHGREARARRTYTAYKRALAKRIAATAARIDELERDLASQV